MRDTKNRLCKLLNQCQTFEQFKTESIRRSAWVFAPYVAAGHIINAPWLAEFWQSHKKQVVNHK